MTLRTIPIRPRTTNTAANAARCCLIATALSALLAIGAGADDPPVKAEKKNESVPPAGAPIKAGQADKPAAKGPMRFVPDAKQSGGEPDGIVQVANLVYAGTKSSRCFSDHFLIKAEKDSAVSTSRRFHAVKLGEDAIFEFPLLIMTGEGEFRLSDAERSNLRRYVRRGGLLLASAGCSSTEWDRAFRREMAAVFPDNPLQPIGLDHPMFHTVYDIKSLQSAHGTPKPLTGVTLDGRLGVVYSQDGLNDTGHTQGCCCCGGNELRNAIDICVNILAYALTY